MSKLKNNFNLCYISNIHLIYKFYSLIIYIYINKLGNLFRKKLIIDICIYQTKNIYFNFKIYFFALIYIF